MDSSNFEIIPPMYDQQYGGVPDSSGGVHSESPSNQTMSYFNAPSYNYSNRSHTITDISNTVTSENDWIQHHMPSRVDDNMTGGPPNNFARMEYNANATNKLPSFSDTNSDNVILPSLADYLNPPIDGMENSSLQF